MHIKTYPIFRLKAWALAVGFMTLVLLPLLTGVISVKAQDLTQGFTTDEKLLRGAIVSRDPNDNNKVDSATADNIDYLYGVVVRSNESALTLSSDNGGVFVATSGRYEMLVSDINGTVKEGDYLTVSPIQGIAMKADDRQARVIGVALQTFDTSNPNNVLTNMDVQEANGQTRNTDVGRILVDLNVKNNPLAFGIKAPEVLIQIGESIAGGPISVSRVWGALIVVVLSFLTGSLIFYAGVRTSIIAVGRNPLSKASVLRGFLQITLVALAIFVTGGFAVYLILKL